MSEPSDSGVQLERRMLALAVLKANWDEGRGTYVDVFLPFVMECAYHCCEDKVLITELRDCLSREFGPAIPEASVRLVLRRASQQGLGRVDGHHWVFERSALATFDSTRRRADLAREQRALVAALQEHAQQEHGEALTTEEAERALADHIGAAGSDVLLRSSGREYLSSRAGDYVAGSFIEKVLAEEPQMAQYLERLVVGTMLAAAIHAPDVGEIEDPFRDLTVYLDTPVLIDLLGRVGDTLRDAARESVRLLNEAGAAVACFEHTSAEVQSIYHGLADSLRDGFRRGRPPVYGSLEEYAIANKLSSSDLLAIASQVPANLGRLGIRTVEPPDLTASTSVVDETEALRVLEEEVHAGRRTARRAAEYDLDSLTATYRMRGGRRDGLETARAIFVTRNRSLVRVASRLFRTTGVPIAMHASDIVTIAWLKKPRTLPDLPRLRLAADAFAASRPSPVLIEKYTDVLMDLKAKGDVTETELYELRYATEAHAILMAKTHGSEERLSEPTVIEILEETRRAIQDNADALARVELETVRGRLELAESARQAAEDRAARQEEIAAEAQREARRQQSVSRRLRIGLAALIGACVLVLVPLLWVSTGTPDERSAVVVFGLLGLGAAVAVGFGKKSAGMSLGAVAFLVGLYSGVKDAIGQ